MRHLLVFAFAMLLAPLALQAQDFNPKYIFRELKALDGVWFMPTDRGDRLEMWSVTNDSTLTGRHVRIRAETGDTVTLETKRIEWRGDSINYVLTIRGQNQNTPIVYRLTKADYDGYLFENPDYGDPKKILYTLLGNRELQIKTEGVRGGRTLTQEYVFEREFNPSAVELRLRAAVNVFNLKQTGNLLTKPEFAPRPGWELSSTFAFKGRGGFITLNADLGIWGRDISAKSAFVTIGQTATGADTIVDYQRDVTYRQAWLGLGVYPEITLKRDGRLSVFAGPYVARLLLNGTKGTVLPAEQSFGYSANDDFNKTDLGLLFGLQYKFNPFKKDFGGIIGVRGSFSLANVDNLYDRGCNNPAYCNGRIGLQGIALYYSVNLLNL